MQTVLVSLSPSLHPFGYKVAAVLFVGNELQNAVGVAAATQTHVLLMVRCIRKLEKSKGVEFC